MNTATNTSTNAATAVDAASALACGQAIARFYARLDGLEPGSVGALFEADGVWHRQGAVLQGPEAVDAALRQRPAGRTSLHLVSNLQWEAEGPALLRARYLLPVFRHDAAPGPAGKADPGPAPMAGSLLGITHTFDTWALDGAGEWRLREKDSRVLFLRE